MAVTVSRTQAPGGTARTVRDVSVDPNRDGLGLFGDFGLVDVASNAAPTWLSMDEESFVAAYPLGARPNAHLLNRRVARALRDVLSRAPTEADLDTKPLELHLELPLPPNLRIYAFLATQHAAERQTDTYKIQLTHVSRFPERCRWKFDREEGIRPVLLGYAAELDLFILWDADVNDAGPGFTYSKSVQAPPDLIYRALANGIATDTRRVRSVGEEQIVAVRRSRLVEGLLRRIRLSNESLLGRSSC